MENTKFLQLIEIKEKIALLEQQETLLQEEVLKQMAEEKLEKVETERGLVTKTQRTSYKYSTAIAEIEAKVKEAKKIEQEQGIAQPIVTESLRVTLR